MKINDDYLYHGAALTQIAEHPQFTAINAVRVGGGISQSAFRINDSIGVYLKYASEPKPPPEDYIFTFTKANKDERKRPAEAGVFRLDCRGDSGLASSERSRCGAVILPCGPRRYSSHVLSAGLLHSWST